MCKKVVTRFTCEGCGKVTEKENKKIGRLTMELKYPKDWDTINGFNYCNECARKYANWYNPAFKQFHESLKKKVE